MFEDFRKQIDDSAFNDDDQNDALEEVPFEKPRQILGLNPVQRFFVAFMLLIMTIVLGTLILLVSSKIALPFTG
jgi:hypothetical protein